MVRHPLFGAASFGAIAQPLSFATATATTATTNAATNTSATTPAAPAALNPRRPTDPLQAGGRERPRRKTKLPGFANPAIMDYVIAQR